MPHRILLVDDHEIVRERLRALLEKEAGMEVVAEAGDGRTGEKLVREVQPDVVVMDIGMPDLNGIEATRKILTRHPDAKVVALSVHTDRRLVMRMLEAGARAYVPKVGAFEELVSAIRAVLDGETYLSPRIAGSIVKSHLRQLLDQDADLFEELTPREREVLQLIAEGRTNRQIGRELHISVNTVETHRANIMDKLELRSVAELTKYAIRRGLTALDE